MKLSAPKHGSLESRTFSRLGPSSLLFVLFVLVGGGGRVEQGTGEGSYKRFVSRRP